MRTVDKGYIVPFISKQKLSWNISMCFVDVSIFCTFHTLIKTKTLPVFYAEKKNVQNHEKKVLMRLIVR